MIVYGGIPFYKYELFDSNMKLCIKHTFIHACSDTVASARSRSCPPSLLTATDGDLHAEVTKTADGRNALHRELTKRPETFSVDQQVVSREVRCVCPDIGMVPCPAFRVKNSDEPDKSWEPAKLVWKPASWRYPERWMWVAPKGSAGVPENDGNTERNKRCNRKRP